MNPTPSDVFVSRPLTLIANNYMADQSMYIADRVFPIVPVQEKSGDYFMFARGDWFRVEARERAPSTESAGAGFRVTQTHVYDTRVYSLHTDLDGQTLAAAQSAFNLERSGTEFVAQDLMLLKEQKWANTYFKTGVWGRERAGVAANPTGSQFLQWDQANSTPIKDIRQERTLMAQTQALMPQVLVLSPFVYDVLIEHPTIVERMKYTQAGVVTDQLLAALFNVDEILVPHGVINSAAEGAADAFDFIYGKHALLAYRSTVPNVLNPSAGYIFSWTGYLGANAFGSRMKRIEMPLKDSIRIEGDMAFDMKVITPALGTFFNGAVA